MNIVKYTFDHEINNIKIKNPYYIFDQYHYTCRLPTILKEQEYDLSKTNINKIFCAQWLDDRNVLLATKCNKLVLLDTYSNKHCIMNPLKSHEDSVNISSQNCGMHSISINPSRTLIATGSDNVNDIAIYSLPNLQPLCVGWNAHKNWIFDTVWIDDNHVVSGASDSKLALWCIDSNDLNSNDNHYLNNNNINSNSNSNSSDRYCLNNSNRININSNNNRFDCNDEYGAHDYNNNNNNIFNNNNNNNNSNNDNDDEFINYDKRQRLDIIGKFKIQHNTYKYKKATKVLTCKKGKRIRALAYNARREEIAAIAMNATFHLFNAKRFEQKTAKKLKISKENVCLTINNDNSVYAIGSASHVQLLIADTGKPLLPAIFIKKDIGIRSLNFRNHLLSIGTGNGTVLFYDMRNLSFLKNELEEKIKLQAKGGWILRNENYYDYLSYANNIDRIHAIYSHSYDPSGTKLFTAGGPLTVGLYGHLASVWK